jgi:hypothetical protein
LVTPAAKEGVNSKQARVVMWVITIREALHERLLGYCNG